VTDCDKRPLSLFQPLQTAYLRAYREKCYRLKEKTRRVHGRHLSRSCYHRSYLSVLGSCDRHRVECYVPTDPCCGFLQFLVRDHRSLPAGIASSPATHPCKRRGQHKRKAASPVVWIQQGTAALKRVPPYGVFRLFFQEVYGSVRSATIPLSSFYRCGLGCPRGPTFFLVNPWRE